MYFISLRRITNLLLNVVQQASQKGQIGIALNAAWNLPYSEESAEAKLAVARVLAFTFDFFMEPLVTGKYPLDMVNNVGGRLPTFTEQQSKMLKGSYDFIGINYYSSSYAKDVPCSTEQVTLSSDPCANTTGRFSYHSSYFNHFKIN